MASSSEGKMLNSSGVATYTVVNKTITLDVLGDSIEEDDESFHLNVNPVSGAAVLRAALCGKNH